MVVKQHRIILLLGVCLFLGSVLLPAFPPVSQTALFTGLVLCIAGMIAMPKASLAQHGAVIYIMITIALMALAFFVPGVPHISTIVQQLIIPVEIIGFVMIMVLRIKKW